jgi:hypothetical protein
MKYALAALALALVFAACGGDDSATVKHDAAVDAFESDCGFPGDPGNEMGIGKFCDPDNQCPSSAPLCSVIGDDRTHFCTKICQMGSTTACGTGAECTCNSSNQCGCTPSACLM